MPNIPDPAPGDRIRTTHTEDGPQDVLDVFEVDETHVLAGYADPGKETAVIFERDRLHFYMTGDGFNVWNGHGGDWT